MLLCRWSAQIRQNFLVIIIVETFCHVAIIFALKPATPLRLNVKSAIYLANRFRLSQFNLFLYIKTTPFLNIVNCYVYKNTPVSENCELLQEREPLCPHSCPLKCHPGECPPCKVLIKRACHCGAMVHVFECLYFNSLSEKEQIAARSCGGPCHK